MKKISLLKDKKHVIYAMEGFVTVKIKERVWIVPKSQRSLSLHWKI